MKIKSNTKAYCSKNTVMLAREYGRKENKIFEPSSGGIGTRLNMPKARFITTIIEVMK
jgi:hypothetical protein